jgi:hypothetical protein
MQQQKSPVVVIGMGEMGELFARGFLKRGHPIFPILRGMPLHQQSVLVPAPALVVAAVGEDDLDPLLVEMPPVWRNRVALLQNELVPNDWQRHGIDDPTVIVVWFDKKKGRPFVPVLPTPVAGPAAALVVDALTAIEVPSYTVPREDLLYQLVRKNLYILTINIAGLGLPAGATVSQLWERHRPLAESVAAEILSLQEWLAASKLPRERLIQGMLEGFTGDPNHICTGRTAPQRLRRALRIAQSAGITVPELQGLAASIEGE